MSVTELKIKRDEINRQIKYANKARLTESKMRLTGQYVKVVCVECKGGGEERDHRSPTILGACCSCNGFGFLWARKWDGKFHHETDHSGKEGEYPKNKK